MTPKLHDIPPLLRSWAMRVTPGGGRRLALERGALHSGTREPGLTHIDRTGIVDNDGVPVHWYEYGDVDAGDSSVTVVFIHGFTLAAESFYLQVNHLRAQWPDARLLLMDLRGHGQTGAVAPEKCTVEGAADDVTAVLDARGVSGPVILVGHSLGGLVALNLVRRCPDELRGRIKGLILVSASIEALSAQGLPQILASPIADKVYDAVEASPNEADRFRHEVSKYLAPGLAVTVFHRDTDYDLIEFHAAMIHETPLETFVGFFDDLQVHDELAAGQHLDGIPGYVINGDADDVTPMSQAERICEVWPGAWLQTAMGAGHMIPLEAPGILNAAIDRLVGMATPEGGESLDSGR
ncbi:alpha/beta fold hydrolase [Corynebacterium suedekumii]|uniref:Alpha/beta hydrolase n=1 Tax=Corynebacterium suedekumii TaxID=3049801 RepID=A0ABY8VMI1_9CORY|nr:alpha/beta hydrolase [Corynebacterium suedekumii]WIM70191.1 alpha/beta hydrolase [Corynebacterium suedekumii]